MGSREGDARGYESARFCVSHLGESRRLGRVEATLDAGELCVPRASRRSGREHSQSQREKQATA